MKKALIISITVIFLSMPVYAESITVFEEQGKNNYLPEGYISEKIIEILENNGYDASPQIEVSQLLKTVINCIREAVISYAPLFTELLGIIFIISIFSKIIDNYTNIKIIHWVNVLSLSCVIFNVFSLGTSNVVAVLKSSSELLTAILPSFVSVTLLGGGTFSSASIAASFSAVLALLEILLSDTVSVMVIGMGVFLVFEHISPVLSDMNITKSLKKYATILLSLVTTLMLTTLSFQNILSSRSDSLSARTVKFAAANFIPIIGNAVGEALRTMSSGVGYLKSTVGISSAIAIFVTVAPTLLQLIVIKLFMSFVSFLASACSCVHEREYITGCVNIIDFLLAIIICSIILSFFIVVAFISLTFEAS